MDEKQAEAAFRALTFNELAGLYRASCEGLDPRQMAAYSKVAHLYTEDDGRRMHPDALLALDEAVTDRLNDILAKV